MATLAIPTIMLILFTQLIISNLKTTFYDVCVSTFGIIYIVGFMLFLCLILELPHGKLLLWYVLFASWGTDLIAFFVGKAIGKHKFSKVSPKKSIEGCIGGIIGAAIFMLGYTFFLNQCFAMEISYTYMVRYFSCIKHYFASRRFCSIFNKKIYKHKRLWKHNARPWRNIRQNRQPNIHRPIRIPILIYISLYRLALNKK